MERGMRWAGGDGGGRWEDGADRLGGARLRPTGVVIFATLEQPTPPARRARPVVGPPQALRSGVVSPVVTVDRHRGHRAARDGDGRRGSLRAVACWLLGR